MEDEKKVVENTETAIEGAKVEQVIKNEEGKTASDNVSEPKKKKGKWKKVLLVLLILLIIGSCAGVTYWAVFVRKQPEPKKEQAKILEPDVAPGDKEKNAESMGDEGDAKLDQPEGGGAVSITYSKDVVIDLSDKKVSLLFGNPSRSNQVMVLQIVIQDEVVVQSDTLEPGYQVKQLDLKYDLLKPGTYKGKFNVLYYDADTGKKAVVNTEIPIDIEVQQ